MQLANEMNPKFEPNATRRPPPIAGGLPVFDRSGRQIFLGRFIRRKMNVDKRTETAVYGSASSTARLDGRSRRSR